MPILEMLAPLALNAAIGAGGYLAKQGLSGLFGDDSKPSRPSGGRSSTSEFFGGTPGRFEQVGRYSPQQQQALNQLLSQAMSQAANPMAGFEPFAQQARQQFQTQTVPSLAERFTGTGGALSSPAFASQLGSAGSQLETNLASLGSQYGLQSQGNLLNLLRFGLSPQFDTYQLQGQPGLVENFLPSLLKLLPYLGRFGSEYMTQGKSQGESPFWEALLAATGGASLPQRGA